MKRSQIVIIILCVILMVPAVYISAQTEMLQIPTLQACIRAGVEGKAKVVIRNGSFNGTFWVKIKAKCNPAGSGYPEGIVELKWVRPNETQGSMNSINIDQLTVTGKVAPMLFVSGTCDVSDERGGRFWIMIADESSASSNSRDVISFVILNGKGQTVGHGAGQVEDGDISIVW